MTESNLEPRSSIPASRDVSSRIDKVDASPSGAQEMAAARLAVEVVSLLHRTLEATGVSQARLAELLDLSPGAVSQVVNGDGNVRIATVGRYFRALGYQPRLFLDPVEPDREIIASRATCAAIQGEFATMIRGALTETVNYWGTTSVHVDPLSDEQGKSNFMPLTGWIDVDYSFALPSSNRDPDAERVG